MKIQIKTLKSKKYELEVKEDESVKEIKEKIQKELGLGDAAMMSLIHHGKILKNDQSAGDAGMKENDFVVLMLKKKKKRKKKKEVRPTPQATTTATVNASAATEQPSAAAQPVVSEAPAASAAAPAPENPEAAASGQNSAQGANAFVMGNQLNAAVQNLVAMGFPEAEVLRAMRAAYNNPERAAEYLLTGIPQNVAAAPPPQQAAANPQPPAAQPVGAQAPAAAANPMAAAAAAPLQRLMQQNPESMAAILQHLMRHSPELFHGIGNDGNINQAAIENLLRDENFMRMMMQAMQQGPEGVGAGPVVGAGPAAAGPRVGAAAGPGMGRGAMMGQQGAHQGAAQPPMGNPNVIRLTQVEAASINRLQALGFSKQQSLEAFLVCNKNEQMAANYLFENANDFGAAAVGAPAGQPAAAQPVNPAPQVAPPVQPVAAEAQPAAEQANDAQAQAPQAEEANEEAPVNQMAAIANAQRAQQAERDNEEMGE